MRETIVKCDKVNESQAFFLHNCKWYSINIAGFVGRKMEFVFFIHDVCSKIFTVY